MVKINKIIHQTWKDNNIPDKWKNSIPSFKKNHPEWKHMYSTDKDIRNFVKLNYPKYLDMFDRYPYNIQRADFIRPLLLYHYGGIYVDMDSICLKNMDELFKKKGVFH